MERELSAAIGAEYFQPVKAPFEGTTKLRCCARRNPASPLVEVRHGHGRRYAGVTFLNHLRAAITAEFPLASFEVPIVITDLARRDCPGDTIALGDAGYRLHR